MTTDLNVAFERIGNVFNEHKVEEMPEPFPEAVDAAFAKHKVVHYVTVSKKSIQLMHTDNSLALSEVLYQMGWTELPLNPKNFDLQIVQWSNFSIGILQQKPFINNLYYLVGYIPCSEDLDLFNQISFFSSALIFYAPPGIDHSEWEWNLTQCVQGFPHFSDAFEIVEEIRMIYEDTVPTPIVSPEIRKLIEDTVISMRQPESDLS